MKGDNKVNLGSFATIDIGTGEPTSVPMEIITTKVGADDMIGDYVKGFISEVSRVAPLVVESVQLTPEELEEYVRFLIAKRIEIVHGTCKDFSRLKVLYIPAFIQFALSLIGKVVLREVGLTIVPIAVALPKMTLEQAIAVSEKIGSFERRLVVLQNAMPRDEYGDKDFMSTALIADNVRSMTRVSHPVFSYMSAFIGMKLQEEAAFKALYRIQYDDIVSIRMALLTQGVYQRC